jgi:carboxyl-terminal processing protease
VPVKVCTNISYFDQLQAKRVLQQYASEYADRHRETLAAMQYKGYYSRFEVSDLMLKKLVAQADKAGIAHDDKVFHTVKERIRLLLKAYIARNIWAEHGFYPIYHQDDEVFQRSLQLFEEAEALIKQSSMEEE